MLNYNFNTSYLCLIISRCKIKQNWILVRHKYYADICLFYKAYGTDLTREFIRADLDMRLYLKPVFLSRTCFPTGTNAIAQNIDAACWMRSADRQRTYRKLEQGWMTQWPAAFCLIRSFISAFLLPKSFMANLLSVGWNRAWSWFFKKLCLTSWPGRPGPGSSFGVP